jgi:hypothetical protein
MAISPMQARSSVRQQLTDEEKQQAAELEVKIDAKLADIFGHNPNSLAASFNLEDTPGDSVSPAVLAELIERYKSAGWREVIVHASNPDLQLQFNR